MSISAMIKVSIEFTFNKTKINDPINVDKVYYSKLAASGDHSQLEVKEKSVAMCAGLNGRAKAGNGSAFALAWYDKKLD